ncbi:proteophosphoglycan ppg4 [Moniliophthora roreri MCA 2997]|uniref:Proteophosphoglycan ppg4 n=2 Tax=Moniliophthora roreri TaxID=221103 RepID=V2WXG2_MONRO|nr:proteophosphoglycan ppg4 [Moniliophthora roreri MCA 2997]KAI3615952.1 proteophosphoglycan ppg4 [Moniliophthora roreri]
MSSSSDESSSSSSSSGTPPPVDKSKGKGKGKGKGRDASKEYVPTKGFKVVNEVNDSEEWDWDAFKENEDLELWLIRVPDNVKLKHLEGVPIELSRSSKSTKVGTINKKNSSCDIWNIGDDASDQLVGGEEMKHISCVLPRRTKKGELRLAPRPIARHLVVSAPAVTPSTPEDGEETPIQLKNPPRHSYPKELLTHRFVPYGSLLSENSDAEDSGGMVVNQPEKGQSEEAITARIKRKKLLGQEQNSPTKKAKKVKVVK